MSRWRRQQRRRARRARQARAFEEKFLAFQKEHPVRARRLLEAHSGDVVATGAAVALVKKMVEVARKYPMRYDDGEPLFSNGLFANGGTGRP